MSVSSRASGRILAGVDIGKLTCRLLIAEISPSDSLRELRSDRRILRLGQDVDRMVCCALMPWSGWLPR
jgi:exopolyphosphatase / guanosine-5'-triphosphate,3'-diphosphate pyrophosphatase